jgi:sphinganine-1-phosphate aldolase
MFRHKKLRQYQLYVNTEWNGGIYGTTSMAGSRPGSVIAGSWASLLKFGRNGLKEKARGILEAQKQIKLAFKDDLDIIVTSTDASQTFSFTSNTVNAIAMSAEMSKRHW